MNASNPAAYGCECIKDDDSIMSERCWKEMYRGDSRKWLIRDASRQKIDSSVCSTTKATFPHPDLTMEEQFVGIRRKILLQKLYEEITEEIVQEKSQKSPVEEYCTEYDGSFNADGFKPTMCVEKDNDLKEKYPLYRSSAASYWEFELQRNRGVILGVTASIDTNSPFKKSASFSKPISEVLDE